MHGLKGIKKTSLKVETINNIAIDDNDMIEFSRLQKAFQYTSNECSGMENG